jgi:N12 class adenine-specific DNA methylase
LKARRALKSKDKALTFEEMGVDFLFIDEAHEFRKLDFATNRTAVKGIDANGSQRALDLYIKLLWLNEQRPGRAAVLASGTPVTNTMAEIYTVMRYMDQAGLERDGLQALTPGHRCSARWCLDLSRMLPEAMKWSSAFPNS